MSRFFDLVSKPAREMGGFLSAAVAEAISLDTQPRLIKLDSNENPFGPSPRAVEAMRSALAAANSYPDDDCTELRRKLAAHHDVPTEQVLVTAGSTALLGLLCQTMLAPGLNAVTSERSFIVYSMAVHAIGAQLIETPMRGRRIRSGGDSGGDQRRYARSCFWRIPTIRPERCSRPRQSTSSLPKFRGMWSWFWTRRITSLRRTSRLRRKVEYSESLKYLAAGRERGCAANVFEGAWTGGAARGIWSGAGGTAGLLRAHAGYVFRVVGGAGGGAGGARRPESRWASRFEQCGAGADSGRGIVGVGIPRGSDGGEFSLLRFGRGCFGIRGAIARGGSERASAGGWGAPNCIRVSIGTPEQNQLF